MTILAVGGAGNQTLTISLFAVVLAITLGITIWASRQSRTAADFYAGGRSFSGLQNGLAIGGDYMSAASFLGIAGIIALSGYDGFLYSIGFLVAWLIALLLIAELIRNTGRFTMADVLAFRLKQRPVRTAAATSTIVVSIFYLLAQMVGAGALVGLLLGVTGEGAKILTIIGVGLAMIFYVVVGGMKGTTWVQIVKAVLLILGALLMTVLVLAKFNFNIGDLLAAAAKTSGPAADPQSFLNPGLRYGKTDFWSKIDLISLGIALVLGTAGLPHILIRFYTVPSAQQARRSVFWAIGIIGLFYLLTLALGFGAAALVKTTVNGKELSGAAAIKATDPGGNTAAPLLAENLGGHNTTGGAILLAVIAAVAFATILAVVAGLTLASSSSFAHDLYANVIRKGQATEKEEVRVARLSAVAIGIVAIILGIFARGLNVAFLVAIAFAIAASANLPTILFSLFWKKFTTRGATWGIYGGLAASLLVLVLSPIALGGASTTKPAANYVGDFETAKAKFDGAENATAAAKEKAGETYEKKEFLEPTYLALVASADKALAKCGVKSTDPEAKKIGNADALFSCTAVAPIPLDNPGIISIPLGFLFAFLGSVTGRERRAEDLYPELETRSLTGIGAEGSTDH